MQRRHRPVTLWRLCAWAFWAACGAAVLALAGLAFAIDQVGRTPREIAPYLQRRAEHHNPIITHATALAAGALMAADRGPRLQLADLPTWIGASPARHPQAGPARQIATIADLKSALRDAKPGDIFELLPGTYRVDGVPIPAGAPGTAAAPIVLRAARLGDAVIESNIPEAIKVTAPYWIFQNLEMHGTCGGDDDCEHAFHIVGNAHHVTIENTRMENFNAQIKVNGEGGAFPDDGTIVADTMLNTRPRDTGNPVTPIDIDAASNWRIHDNFVADFIKAGGNLVSYGGFAKLASQNTIFDRNVVICEFRLHGFPGQRIGLSFGGGGETVPEFSRDHGRTGLAHKDGAIRDNLIASCSDVGIYLNRAANATIAFNTLLDTAGISIRYPESSATVEGNIVDGAILARDGGLLREGDNLSSALLAMFVGWHAQRGLFADPARLDLRWRTPPSTTAARASDFDLCGAPRQSAARYGAFDDYAACVARPPDAALPAAQNPKAAP
jgi:hypothetical protein